LAKDRVPIPDDIAASVLFAADRTCCVCNQRGLSIQIHHINDDPSDNEPANLAVLCLECHDDTQLQGGFGRKLNGSQLRKYRDEWDQRVVYRRAEADRLAASISVAAPPALPTEEPEPFQAPHNPPSTGLVEYVNTLPTLKALAYNAAQPGWSGATIEMVDSSWSVVDALLAAMARLARWYPYEHFGKDARQYFAEVIAARARWHYQIHSTGGVGFSGTIIGPITASSVVSDAEQMVADMVSCLLGFSDGGFEYGEWLRQWRSAGRRTSADSE
jgi:hypothetical protein